MGNFQGTGHQVSREPPPVAFTLHFDQKTLFRGPACVEGTFPIVEGQQVHPGAPSWRPDLRLVGPIVVPLNPSTALWCRLFGGLPVKVPDRIPYHLAGIRRGAISD